LVTSGSAETWRQRDRGDSILRGETGHQTDQESRSDAQRGAASVIVMDLATHASLLPYDDPAAALACHRDHRRL
jgi:hypothetical protein